MLWVCERSINDLSNINCAKCMVYKRMAIIGYDFSTILKYRDITDKCKFKPQWDIASDLLECLLSKRKRMTTGCRGKGTLRHCS